ncbi:MAG: hypothetical protein K0Q43_186 [Ramlibacter sp.]|jgi:hypothetical protein|nr:hypothetical protein [Ramlibacter sp.]
MGTATDLFAQSLVDMGSAIRQRQAAERDADAREAAQAEEAAVLAKWQQAYEQVCQANASNLAEKHALRQQLQRYAPNHPLLKNAQLIEKIREMGGRAFAINANFDDARQVGDSYFPPGTPPLSK